MVGIYIKKLTSHPFAGFLTNKVFSKVVLENLNLYLFTLLVFINCYNLNIIKIDLILCKVRGYNLKM
jgi:hypothetical protein